ncbi:(2Fe-2S)-binding protein [Aliiroseovarius subalbicans]|uniref:(2Fe-2S)-binding protein n=1 Tax=Aliiroseovarius subalbicans TaxID=2925840 RepID=UPI001F57C398|nr:(2Fe-2S)-binding protein [Aliiroseovarius subalbicans]MCI2400937.1 (2Fe-2S)-binding protein [Aliiroseovarius subalbicans]
MINGEERSLTCDPRTPLVDVLRNELRLTGTRNVCREGYCGACSVHVDGKPMSSCLLPVGTLEGRDIVTIEGISQGDKLDVIQQAFIDLDVIQCGMCFPGMVMTLRPFLRDNPSPSRDAVKFALVGNVCRCTGYERIIDAVMSVVDATEVTE